MRLNTQLHPLWYLAVAILAAVGYGMQPWWTVDDAYISYRYAFNWVHHGQLTWNINEQPFVEGYTGIFLPILAAVCLKVGLPLLSSIKIFGILAFLGCIWTFLAFAKALNIKASLQIIGLGFILLSPLFYLHSISGLETIFFSFFLLGTLFALHNTTKANWGMHLGVWLLLLLLCRPEGYLFLAILPPLALIYRKDVYQLRNNALAIFTIAYIPAIALLIWRHGYYGEWLPNTFFVKKYTGLFAPDSIKAFLQFLVYYLLIPISLGIGAIAFNKSKNQLTKSGTIALVAGSLFILLLLFVYFRSNLYMNYASRFFLPIYLPCLLFALKAFSQGSEGKINLSPKAKTAAKVLIGLSLACYLLVIAWRFREEWHFLNYYDAIVKEELEPAGKYLKENLPKGSRIVSYMDAGALAYYSELEIIDFGRLNSYYLAHPNAFGSQVSGKELVDYFFELKADAAVFTSESAERYVYLAEAEEIVQDPRFQAYKMVKQWSNHLNYPYFQQLYIRQH